MKTAQFLGAAAIGAAAMLVPVASQAQQTIESVGLTITTTPAATTNYLFRGISQTRNRPAGQLTVDIEHSSGFYVGTFISNANFAGTNIRQEVDGNIGYRFALGGLKLDLGVTYFGYPGYDRPTGGFDAAWWEGTLRATYEIAPVKLLGSVAWSPNFNFESGNAVYVEGGVDISAPLDFTISGRAGYQWIERNFATSANRGSFGAPDYGVFSIGLSREIFAGFIGSVTGSTTTLDRNDCFGGAKICGDTVVFTLSRPF